MNISCIICSDLFKPSHDVFITPCGHIFHHACLLQWIERSKTCPQCRYRTTNKTIIKVYFNIANTDGMEDDVCTLNEKLDNANLELQDKERDILQQQKSLSDLKDLNRKATEIVKGLEDKIRTHEEVQKSYREQIKYLKCQTNLLSDIQLKNKTLNEQILKMRNIEDLLKSSANDVDDMMAKHPDAQSLATYVTVIKRELVSSEHKRKEMLRQMKQLQIDLLSVKTQRNKLRLNNEDNKALEEELKRLEQEKNGLLSYIKNLEANITSKNLTETQDIAITSPTEISRKRTRSRSIEKVQTSPSLDERVQSIQESNSPYLNVQSSSIGITPLRNLQATSIRRKHCTNQTEKYSIFKKPRLTLSSPPDKYTFDTMGGQCKVENITHSLVIPSRSNFPPTKTGTHTLSVNLPKITSHKMKGLARPRSALVIDDIK